MGELVAGGLAPVADQGGKEGPAPADPGQGRQLAELKERLEASGRLIRMIVHDLKGPLASLMANLDLLLSSKLDHCQRDILETAIQGGNDLLIIINTLLEIGKMERGQLELNLSIIDLGEISRATAAKLKTLTGQKRLALKTDRLGPARPFAADASLIERVIFNLMMNAIKYTREGGTISLSNEAGPSGAEVVLAVADNGIGIPREYHERIFDLYTQIQLPGERRGDRPPVNRGPEAPGAPPREERRRIANVGIGLAFCKLAVQQHGGRIWVDSEPGKGSTFFVALPTNLVPSGSGLL